MKYLRGTLLPALLLALASFATAKKNDPLVAIKTFPSELSNIQYFDDSKVVLLGEIDTGRIWRSTDAGKEWNELKKDIIALAIIKNPFDNNVAIVVGETTHWITYDQGETWTDFDTADWPSGLENPVGWHAGDNKKIIFNTRENCRTKACIGKSYYTTDGFKTHNLLRDDRKMCLWARSSERFLADDEKHQDRILCVAEGQYSDLTKDFRLLISDDYFEHEFEPTMSSGRVVSGMANMASVKGYFVAAAKSDHSSELALYVTDDTETWHHAEFGEGKIEEDAYTILESTNYSIQVDVMTSRFAFVGSLYTSNSNGTYFTKNIDHTNRNLEGFVDFEKVSNIQGVVLVNVVDNWEDVHTPLAEKKLKSKISFDDGRTFEPLKAGDKDLHLHSVTDLRNSGRVFSSPAPGLVMGVGNTGKYLRRYTDGDLYVSDDAGVTWTKALDEAHKYEFGDQGSVLVAVYDEGDTDKIMYSLNHGKDWDSKKLDAQIRFRELTTVPDSTSLKFIGFGAKVKEGGGREWVVVHIDFSEMHEDTCGKDDFEDWPVRKEADGTASCVMGHKQIFRRRKKDVECFVNKPFEDPTPSFEPCECEENRDYECDYNFKPSGEGDDKKCVPSGQLELPKGACEGDKTTYTGSSGWRKIPGNQCKGETKKDKEIERDCKESEKTPASGKIATKKVSFKGASSFQEWYYLERGSESKGTDETIVMRTYEREAWITHDHGKEWKKAVDEDVIGIYPHQYNNDYVYFLTAGTKVYYSTDRGKDDSVHYFDAPQMPAPVDYMQWLQFHPKQKDWLIWTGGEHCKGGDRDCHTMASVSTNNGGEWKGLLPFVQKCAFVWREQGRQVNEKLVFCEQHTNEEMAAPLELISSEDWFETKDVKYKSVVEFATMSEFIIVATKAEDSDDLKLDASLDGVNFADAQFPPKFQVDTQRAYTVLDSSTHSVFLHVTVNWRSEQEYGSIIKSNSNGTSYIMSLSAVNRNTAGYVDFEKMQGIEGVALANVVPNFEKVNEGAKKEKKTQITHNDGSDWEFLQIQGKDSTGNDYECDTSDLAKCSLHLHGFTERRDPREQYSSPTAVGIMMGVGNVGGSLGSFGEANTFMTTDAGVTWKEIMKGNFAWEFGDQGSIIVIVERGKSTKELFYSTDMGGKWKQFDFHKHEINVQSITTVPSDTSLNFLIWGSDGKELLTVNVDFSGLDEFQEQCDLEEQDPTGGDYDLWTPEHPMLKEQPQCLFGHIAEYHRKKPDANCYNGRKIDHLHHYDNCTCERRDFECDYNYERLAGGTCQLVEGLPKPEGKAVCNKKGVKEWWEITGYRKIPISTCSGGRDMEHTSQVHPCPGYEDDFERKHGISGFGIFLAVVLPFLAAGGIGWYVWKNWDGKFGRIRLGEGYGAVGGGGQSAWVAVPIAVLSGIVAVVAAVPMLIGSMWRAVSSRFGGYGGRTYTSRSSFARGRGDYAVVDPDEGELLGDESDEDV
ncbi:vacuolar protein sorting/targeting protein 10 [Polyplosphaeria fusca]|uniref:Vacuolar protein sorting/targeting protein 10 n=1 Tax=Polyplosphaeria fusca TaxID=682080 RepID=A0A9P4QYB9_9PLEO|nr:vacuolar protein sorting/targeting protein 10 [Polyplosphaeria fusca]